MSDGAGGSSSLCGPLCNHPNKGCQPNVMYYPAICDTRSLPSGSADALRRISWYDQPPWTFDGARRQRTLVLIALRDLEDEELFVDYRYAPESDGGAALPAWYSQVERVT